MAERDSTLSHEHASAPGWSVAIAYLHYLVADEYPYATRLLDEAVERDGLGEVNGALADVCRALLDRIVFEPGTIDVHAAISSIADRVHDAAGPEADNDDEARTRLRTLLVFLGSEGLPCTARTEVSAWAPAVRLQWLTTMVAGLTAIVATDEHCPVGELVASLEPPEAPTAALGTFSLAWRGPDGCPLLGGVVPKGYEARMTFLGSGTCSLRAIFARVAYLRTPRTNASPRQLGGRALVRVTATTA